MYAKTVNKEGSIKIYYKNEGRSLWISTGVTQIPDDEKFFNYENGKLTRFINEYDNKNILIANKLATVEKIIVDHMKFNDGAKPTIEYVKMKLAKPNDKSEGKSVLKAKQFDSFKPYYDQFYEEKKSEARVLLSLKDYISNQNILFIYQKKYGKLTLDKMASVDFLKSFEKFLSQPIEDKEYKAVKGQLNNNTISKRMSYLRTFLNWCEENDFIVLPPKVKNYKTIVGKYKPTIVVFNDDEIKKLQELELKNETDCALRDYMLVLAGTGMRFSDLVTLNKEMVEDNYITKKAGKNKVVFSVPISNKTLALIKKYNYTFHRFKNQTFNRMIKELLFDKEICLEKILVTNVILNKEVTVEAFKYKEIGSHTGRRTFVANCFREGFNIGDIMGMTGHKKVETLLIYKDLFAKDDTKKKRFMKSKYLI